LRRGRVWGLGYRGCGKTKRYKEQVQKTCGANGTPPCRTLSRMQRRYSSRHVAVSDRNHAGKVTGHFPRYRDEVYCTLHGKRSTCRLRQAGEIQHQNRPNLFAMRAWHITFLVLHSGQFATGCGVLCRPRQGKSAWPCNFPFLFPRRKGERNSPKRPFVLRRSSELL